MSFSQQTFVPDDNFEQAIIDLGYDTTLDDYVTTADINGVTSLVINNRDIADLTGIEDFTSLNVLICYGNLLTSLDLSQNTELTSLDCGFNQLTSLNSSSNTLMSIFNCRMNQLTTLDVTPFTDLTSLKCSGNPIGSLNVTQNAALTNLECAGNQLNSLDLTQNPMLSYVLCAGNPFTELNVSQNPMLTYIGTNNCSALASLDLTQNTVLTELECVGNPLTELDLSLNTALTYLNCNNNDLTVLNVKNGNNTNVTYFYAANNSNLTCITVDDVAYSTTNWTDIDAQTSFDEDCSLSVNEHGLNETIAIYPNPVKGMLNISMEMDGIYNILSINGQIVKQGIIRNGKNRIDVSTLSNGIYFIKIKIENGELSKKLVLK